MPIAKLTSKGQVTIPKEVREALHVQAGDRVHFFIRDDGVVEVRSQTVDLNDLHGVLESKGKPVTVEAMNEATGKAVVQAFKKSVGK